MRCRVIGGQHGLCHLSWAADSEVDGSAGEAEAVMEVLRDNMQTQLDSLREDAGKHGEEQVRSAWIRLG
jgi:hypothetical protein